MKHLFFLFAVLGCLLACSHNETDPKFLTAKFSSEKFPQKWQLVSMQGNIANMPPVTGSKMSWQEFYVFNANGALTKTRERNGLKKTINGKFSFKEIGTEKFLEIIYETDSDLIGNCYATATEELFIKSDTQLSNTWNACDGPGLMYNRIE